MLVPRRSAERGHFDHGWLETWHTFSFGDYFDPAFHGFRVLRVLNEDVVAPLGGFPAHPHRDMEILTWILSGALEHGDSMGNGSIIRPGEAQLMTAGRGVVHSEKNPSPTDPVHLLQIWLFPSSKGLEPRYQQRKFQLEDRTNRLRLLVSPDGQDHSLEMHQDARIWNAVLDAGRSVASPLAPERHAWIQVARGEVDCNGVSLSPGDGAAVSGVESVAIAARAPSEVLLFDLP